jgi:hypothetical protein
MALLAGNPANLRIPPCWVYRQIMSYFEDAFETIVD